MEEYSEHSFYIHATDKRGHSSQIRVGLPPERLQEISRIVQSGKYPYRTQQDFLRDAMIHRMASLGKLDDEAQVCANAWVIAAKFAEREARIEASERILDSARTLARNARSLEEREDLRDLIKDALAQPLPSLYLEQLTTLLSSV